MAFGDGVKELLGKLSSDKPLTLIETKVVFDYQNVAVTMAIVVLAFILIILFLRLTRNPITPVKLIK